MISYKIGRKRDKIRNNFLFFFKSMGFFNGEIFSDPWGMGLTSGLRYSRVLILIDESESDLKSFLDEF